MILPTYYTVVIPPNHEGRATKWHSHTTLTRGVFPTPEKAHDWAKEHLGGTEYSVREC